MMDGYDPIHWSRPQLHEGGRLSHLVFVDGRLVDAWSEDVRDSAYDLLARQYDVRRTPAAQPDAPPRHEQVLAWLDELVGGRSALLALDDATATSPELRDVMGAVPDESWFVVDELLVDATDALLPAGLGAPLRECLLALHRADDPLVARREPAKIAAGIIWVVGKANGTLTPRGGVRQKDVAAQLGLTGTLASHGRAVLGSVARLTWSPSRAWGGHPDLLVTGHAELLCQQVRSDLVRQRDDALAERGVVLPSGVE